MRREPIALLVCCLNFTVLLNSASATISEAYANHIVSECEMRSLFYAASAVSEVCDLHYKTASHKL